jgi:hypothetical protein
MVQTNAEKNQNTVLYVCVSKARSARLVLDCRSDQVMREYSPDCARAFDHPAGDSGFP